MPEAQDASTSQLTGPSEKRIGAGHTVLLRLPSGEVKSVKLEDATVPLGKFGSFESSELIGQPYGLSYEIVQKVLRVLPPKTMQDVEDTDATNELINDESTVVQPLTLEEIEALKKSGAHSSDIIQKQIEQHANFALKTEYSKEKYRKRKEAKFSKTFTTIEPTLFNVCDFWFQKDQSRIRDIRPDSLGQILNSSNVRPGGKYIVVDDTSGILVCGVLERMGGEGKLITICDVESPPVYSLISYMNFEDEILSVMSSLNWATADVNHVPILPPSEPTGGQYTSERHKGRLDKRKSAADALQKTRDELFAGEFDGLLVSSHYDPPSILERLSPFLAGSASIVIHHPYSQVLADVQLKMRQSPHYLAPTLIEPWLRRYQVLPGRTHPTMSTSGTGGYILSAIKVYDNPDAESVVAAKLRSKKRKAEESESQAS